MGTLNHPGKNWGSLSSSVSSTPLSWPPRSGGEASPFHTYLVDLPLLPRALGPLPVDSCQNLLSCPLLWGQQLPSSASSAKRDASVLSAQASLVFRGVGVYGKALLACVGLATWWVSSPRKALCPGPHEMVISATKVVVVGGGWGVSYL